MIRQLSIKNFAIIDDLTIDFSHGFNIFTGETGAGKSIIIDALGLLLGERASSSMVRHGASKAFVQGVFDLNKQQSEEIMDYVFDEDTLIVTKEIDAQGRSTCKINGRLCSIATIKNIMPAIIDIHNQNENQYLMDHRSHLKLLDNYLNLAKQDVYVNYQKYYQEYRQLLARKEQLQGINFDPEKLEILQHQKKEIEAANIGVDEVEKLELERTRIAQYEKIVEKIKMIDGYFEDEQGILSGLYGAKKAFEALRNDPLFSPYTEKINDFYFEIDAMYSDFKQTVKTLNFDPDRIEEIQNRIFLINKIKRKYGATYMDIMERYAKINLEIATLNQVEQDKILIDDQIKTIVIKLNELGQKIHEIRVKGALQLEKAIKLQLSDLSLENSKFMIAFQKLDNPSSQGLYEGEFQISLNPGTPLKPLIKVISGGEMSRLMLGLKVIFNTLYGLSVTIFDEIDAGVSGKVARSVGKKMKQLSENMQVICITHLPQVASLADVHYFVSKKIDNNNTSTDVTILDEGMRINEIAKMLSGNNFPSDSALRNAKELIFE